MIHNFCPISMKLGARDVYENVVCDLSSVKIGAIKVIRMGVNEFLKVQKKFHPRTGHEDPERK
jgi:hypothetical protein